MTAAQNGHLDVVKYLVKKGADVNKADKDGDTLLCLLQIKVIKKLLNYY